MSSVRILVPAAFWLLTAVTAQYGAMELPAGLSPRYYLGGAQLLERQISGVGGCGVNQHPCWDVGSSLCCDNSEYCIVGLNNAPSCCAIGSDCTSDTPCDSLEYFCSGTSTLTIGTAQATGSCCARSCPSTSAYKCAATYGGNCCSYDAQCGTSTCIPLSTSTTSALVTELAPGCTTNQIACPSAMGGGCCDNGLTCTVLSNTNYCAAGTGTAVRTGTNGILETSAPQSSGLSTGAKAGIGAGLGVAACMGIGILLWFIVLHRREARLSQKADSNPGPDPAMSQVSGSAAPKAASQQAGDYFGPSAVAGPYTTDPTSPVTSPGSGRGVPLSPQGPGDIQVPVEIDSRGHSTATSPGNLEYLKAPEQTQAYELP
ncbi:hypothetical protein V8E51_006032 [Hyaloscypha variabilis]|uniref:Mid2 domain-containing protein n=1 Tax=Hyaloscypha variabilis (strain UAMH 11265 / GT02V1 / F) TaxID=1149755 RepID=A0A2J6S2E4_HYAVF|nr:hypothetical protein L207DRAFT_577882 [Hyaloscypha variabilis F]